MFTTTPFSGSTAMGASERRPGRSPRRLQVYATIAAGSFVSYILHKLTTGDPSTAFAVVGLGACGWTWLLTRALFDSSPHDAWWPRIVVLGVAASAAVAVLAPAESAGSRVAENIYAMSGSAALLLTFVEPFHRYRRDLPAGEKRFRFAFLGIYALLVGVSVLGFRASEDALRDDLIRGACAVVGLGAAMAAVWFRLRHPLTEPAPVRRAPTEEDRRLAERLMRLLRSEGIDSEPDLRIGDVAARLQEPEYRVSQCISAALGFANFNRLINHHRVERAKQRLSDPAETGSILEIAFDCGFGSIGPFNRAFKEQVGSTPRAFRRAAARSRPDVA